MFVGHVTAVRERAAVFAVERGSKHSRYEPGQEVQVPVGESSCDLRFTVGQRWLYAGPMLLEPNRLLENGPLPLDVQAFLEGAPPARLQPGR